MNVMTDGMNRLTTILKNTDSKLKEFGVEPYGTRKATEKEQREMFENMTEEQAWQLIDRYGPEAFNKFVGKFYKEE